MGNYNHRGMKDVSEFHKNLSRRGEVNKVEMSLNISRVDVGELMHELCCGVMTWWTTVGGLRDISI